MKQVLRVTRKMLESITEVHARGRSRADGRVSVILPARNEGASVGGVVKRLRAVVPGAEIVVVDDGSTDDTAAQAESSGARVVRHPTRLGNGAAIKTGARCATSETLVFMDADGQHAPEQVPALLELLAGGFDMAVGARSRSGQANAGRAAANAFYNALSSWIAEYDIRDLTSGFRAARADRFRQFIGLLPNSFSYPTTITMAFLKMGYSVGYLPIEVAQRVGRSHIAPIKDGFRFVLIIFRIATLFSPLKLFFPASIALAMLGLLNYTITYFTSNRFTNMSALLLTGAMIVFFIGLLAEQICALTYAALRTEFPRDDR